MVIDVVENQFAVLEGSIRNTIKKEERSNLKPELISFFLTLKYFMLLHNVLTEETQIDMSEKEKEIDLMVDDFLSS